MIACAAALVAASILRADPSAVQAAAPRLMSLKDAPTTPEQSFGASVLTSFTGLAILGGLATGPRPGQPMSDFSLQARVATSLFLLSVGPSVGDLMNQDMAGFLAGAGGRTLLIALGWSAVSLARIGGEPVLVAGAVLFVTLGALVWVGWGATDLVRSVFAPERWVDRQNQGRRADGVADPTVRPDPGTGSL